MIRVINSKSMEQKYHWHLQQNFSINCQYCTVCFLYWSKPIALAEPNNILFQGPEGWKKNHLSIIIISSRIEICKHYNYPPKKQSIFLSEMNILPQILRSTGIRKKIQWMSISPVTPPLCKSLPAATWEILATLEIRLCHCRHQTYTDWRWQG